MPDQAPPIAHHIDSMDDSVDSSTPIGMSLPPEPSTRPRSTRAPGALDSTRLIGIGAAIISVRIALASTVGLAPDEAYYVEWSIHPSLTYVDHPPAIAWCIRAGTTLFGFTPLGVRALVLVFGALVPFLLYDTSVSLFGCRARAACAALASLIIPLGVVGLTLATPDAPLALGWALCLAGLARGLASRRGAVLLMGMGFIVAAYAKFTGWLLPILVALWLLRSPPALRGRLIRLSACAFTIGILATLPYLLALNAQGWTALRFQFDHGLRGSPGGLGAVLELLSAQAGLVGPAIALGGFIHMIRYSASRLGWTRSRHDTPWPASTSPEYPPALPSERRETHGASFTKGGGPPPGLEKTRFDAAHALLFTLSAPVFGFFALAALRSHPEANWPAVGWLGLLVALDWSGCSRPFRRSALWGGALLGALIALQAAFGILPIREPTGQCAGWDRLAEQVSAYVTPDTQILLADRYQEAASLHFELMRQGRSADAGARGDAGGQGEAGEDARRRTDFGGRPVLRHVGALPGRGRLDQYDLWPAPKVRAGESILWLNRAGKGSAPPLEGFRNQRLLARIHVGRPGQQRAYDLYKLEDAFADHVLSLHRSRR